MKSEKQQVREALLVLAVVASTILLAFLIWFGIIYGIGVLYCTF